MGQYKRPLPVEGGLRYVQYELEKEHIYLDPIRQLISNDLSEPYSIYVYRYFLNQWGDLCYMALDEKTDELRGVVVCKLENHRSGTYRGYIAMLATVEAFRGKGIATRLVKLAIEAMKSRGADEIVLETEVSNTASLRLYERLGFLRSKRLHRYYLNGNTAFRLILYLKAGTALKRPSDAVANPEYGLPPEEPVVGHTLPPKDLLFDLAPPPIPGEPDFYLQAASPKKPDFSLAAPPEEPDICLLP